MKSKDMKDHSDLQRDLLELRKTQFNLRMQAGMQQLSDSSQIKKNRKSIARIKTMQRERVATK